MRLSNPWLQHIANPLHVYCRLIDFGVSSEISKKVSVAYEKYLYYFLSVVIKKRWRLLKKKMS